MRWSSNITRPPLRLNPEDIGELRDRAYPYADTPNVEVNITPTIGHLPKVIVTPTTVTFRGQSGPIREVGVNGCQIDDLITFALGTIQVFNKKFPCRENSLAITKLEEALHWLEARRVDREDRGVEGRDKE